MPDPTFLGEVQDVSGPTVSVCLADSTVSGLSLVGGKGYRIGQIGTFVRVPIGNSDLYGIVSQVGAGAVPEAVAESQPYGNRWLTVQMVGEARRDSGFQRGLSQFPTVGDPVHLVTNDDLQKIYGRADSPHLVDVGWVASADSVPALVDLNKLVSRHSAILGATGSGKSTTVASMLMRMADPTTFPAARILVFDLHGEYSRAFQGLASVFRVGGDPKGAAASLNIPYWALTLEELVPLMLGDIDEIARADVAERVVALKTEAVGHLADPTKVQTPLSVDAPVPFSIHRLWFELHKTLFATHSSPGSGQSEATMAYELDVSGAAVQPGDAESVQAPKFQAQLPGNIFLSSSTLNLRRQVSGLASRLRDSRYDFLFRPGPWKPSLSGAVQSDLDEWLSGILGGGLPITILDLSGVPTDILTAVVGGLLRALYEALFWARYLPEGARERPVLFVLEEAHLYLQSSDRGPAKAAVRRIVKEGRKYGMAAMVVSQRPSEVDSTILSQCGTTIALRITNPSDRGHVASSVSDHLDAIVGVLPTLRTGEAIIVGEGVHLPIRALIRPPPIDRRPESLDPVAWDEHGPSGWNNPLQNPDYTSVLHTWRLLDPRASQGVALMNRIPVSSTNIASMGFDANSSTLEIEFHNGSVYQYYGVPQHEYTELVAIAQSGGSVGKYFNANIRNAYPYARV